MIWYNVTVVTMVNMVDTFARLQSWKSNILIQYLFVHHWMCSKPDSFFVPLSLEISKSSCSLLNTVSRYFNECYIVLTVVSTTLVCWFFPHSNLYQIAHLGDDDGEPEFSSAMQLEEGETFFFAPRPLKNLVLVDELESLSPIMTAKVCFITRF